jgi:hypothetical protein
MPRLAAPICVLLLLTALVAGCGSGGSSTGSTTGSASGSAKPAKKPPSAQVGGAPVGAQAKHCDSRAVDAQALRATGVPCQMARSLMFAWQRSGACALAKGTARGSCAVPAGFRCQAVRAGKGIAVSCSTKGRAVAFLAQRE